MDEREERGVHNPRVIDLISEDDRSGEVVLTMIEKRRWSQSDETTLRELEAKFNAYLEYVLGGHLVKQYPQYTGRPVRFEIECVENPRTEHSAFFRAMTNFAASEQIRFLVRVKQD